MTTDNGRLAMARLFGSISHGVYVIGVGDGENDNAFTAAWVMQTSFNPPMLALSINPDHSSYALLKRGGGFSVNVLAEHQGGLAQHFSAPASTDKLGASAWQRGITGIAVIDDAIAYFECEYHDEMITGDHCIVSGLVVNGRLRQTETPVLSYAATGDMDHSAALFPVAFPPGAGK